MTQERTRRLTPSQQRVLTLLDLAVNKDGVARIAKNSIAKTLAVNVKTVDRAISRLHAEGYIETIPQHDSNGAQLANGYKVLKR